MTPNIAFITITSLYLASLVVWYLVVISLAAKALSDDLAWKTYDRFGILSCVLCGTIPMGISVLVAYFTEWAVL